MEISYDLVSYSDSVRDAYLKLLPEQEQAVARGKLEWKFRDHPGGSGLVAIATTTEQGIVGVNAFMPGRMKLGERTVSGYQSMDTVVSPSARGQGVFSKLVECFYARTDADLLYGFPNPNSSPGFFGRLGWTHFGPVPFLFRPLRAGYFLRRLLPTEIDFRVPLLSRPLMDPERRTSFDEKATGVWHRFARGIPCGVVRDATYLNWRLTSHPVERYTILAAADGSFVVFNVVKKHGGSIGYLMEALGEAETLTQLLSAALHEMQAAGADAALAWCLAWSPNYAAYRKAGFYPLPERLRPIHFNFGARLLRAKDSLATDPRSWYVSYLDSDTA